MAPPRMSFAHLYFKIESLKLKEEAWNISEGSMLPCFEDFASNISCKGSMLLYRPLGWLHNGVGCLPELNYDVTYLGQNT